MTEPNSFRAVLSLSKDDDFAAVTGIVVPDVPVKVDIPNFVALLTDRCGLTNQFFTFLFSPEIAMEFDNAAKVLYTPHTSFPSIYELTHHGIHPIRIHCSSTRIHPEFPVYEPPSQSKVTYIVLKINDELQKPFPFDLSKPVSDLRKVVQAVYQVPPSERFFLMHNDLELLGNASCAEFGLTPGSIVNIEFPQIFYGATSVYATVPQESPTLLREFSRSSSAPDWRELGGGINVDGQCTNKKCACYKQTVVWRFGYGVLDFLHCQPVCPICNTPFAPDRPLFLNCVWYVEFIRQKGVYKQLSKEVAREIRLFEKAELLHFVAQPLRTHIPSLPGVITAPSFCLVCLKPLPPDDRLIFNCGHGAHKNCYERWKQTQSSCSLCTAPLTVLSAGSSS